MKAIADFFMVGGFWMWPIFFAQMASLAIIGERIWKLYFTRTPDLRNMTARFEGELKRGHLDQAMNLAKELPKDSPLRQVVEAGVQAVSNMGGREEVQARIDEVLMREQSRLETRVEFLAMLGNVATLLGLLGTIVGMIKSFAAISQADAVTKSTLLATGVSEAMHATAYGLIVAIPALVLYTVIQSRVSTLSEDMVQAAIRIFNVLGFQYDTIKSKKLG